MLFELLKTKKQSNETLIKLFNKNLITESELKQLVDEDFDIEIGKQKLVAKEYLDSTDWIIAKISETMASGEDTAELIEKYQEQINKRKECRNLL